MSSMKKLSLLDVLNFLRRLDDSSVQSDGVSTQFLEIRKDPQGDGMTIMGNQGGLVHFATLVLEVAEKGFAGAHQHFDEAANADICEAPLVVGFKSAEWDVQ